jgi:hypothetical protein
MLAVKNGSDNAAQIFLSRATINQTEFAEESWQRSVSRNKFYTRVDTLSYPGSVFRNPK